MMSGPRWAIGVSRVEDEAAPQTSWARHQITLSRSTD